MPLHKDTPRGVVRALCGQARLLSIEPLTLLWMNFLLFHLNVRPVGEIEYVYANRCVLLVTLFKAETIFVGMLKINVSLKNEN